jgi:vacuolar protein sorting-associated protein 13A/C
MTLKLRAPIEIENLLPFDIQYRVHDRHTSQSSSSYLVKGGSSPLHNVELSHLLLLSVTPHDTVFKQSEYAIINTDDPELPQERHFQLVDDQKQALVLRLHYL